MFRGTEKAGDIIERGLREGRKVLLYGDPDVDGLMSLKLMCDLFDMKGVSYTYHVNDNREHGFQITDLDSLADTLIVAADFAMLRDEIVALNNHNVYIVSIDHHDIDDTMVEYENGVIINNQYEFEPDEKRYLSGAGMAYEVFCDIYPEFKSKEREAIVGITLLSDARAIENDLARQYLKTTYSSDAEYIRYLIECTLSSDFGFGAPRMDRSFIDFTFSPTVNAMLRFNKTQEAVDLILGKGMEKGISWRDRQRQLLEEMMQKVEILDLKNCYVLAINAKLFSQPITGFIGLLCSRLRQNEKSAIIFAYQDSVVLRASFRGLYDGVEYRDALKSLGLQAEGHSIAFGINNFKPTPDLWGKIDVLIGQIEQGYQDKRTIIEVTNLSKVMLTDGKDVAENNCYVRDMFRTYFKYKGTQYNEVKRTYKQNKDKTFQLDKNGNKITKYIEYLVDGRIVKSFGKNLADGLILPLLEKGYMNLYVE